jgi:hypothetical protein
MRSVLAHGGQPAGDLADHLVPDQVAVLIVDLLKWSPSIMIAASARLWTPGHGEAAAGQLGEAPPVVRAGQRVRHGPPTHDGAVGLPG